MGINHKLKETKLVTGGFLKSFKKAKTGTQTYPIDFVVTWVDGSDPAWLQERAQYFASEDLVHNGNGVGRYRAWSLFRYWFRAVETYAPWVRYVHLVTWGHVPAWLKLDCPKLKIVNHKDYVPADYLPTYNCQPLELNLFRIPGLSEHFVYFNDDVLLARPVNPEDFFVNGKPTHSAIAYPYVNRDNEMPTYLFFNTYGIANKKNNIQACIEDSPEKWFSHKYRGMLRYNIDAWRNSGLPSMFFTHMAAPYCRSTMEKTWKKYEKECDYSSRCRIREIHQITHQIFSIEDILNGHFEPSKTDWGTCLAIDNISGIAAAYQSRSGKMICLFDRDNMTDAEIENTDRQLTALFERIFPEKSDFEKQTDIAKQR